MKEFINDVEQMRIAQKHYFAAIARAKKSKLPEDFAQAKRALEQSKRLEQRVDAGLPKVQDQVSEQEFIPDAQ